VSGPQRLGELLGRAGGAPASGTTPERELAAVWERVVGVEAAKNAHPLHLRRGRLSVATSSPAWAQSLQLMSGRVISGLNEALGAEVVKDVRFQHAGWSPVSERATAVGAPAGPRRRLTPAEEASVAEVARLAVDEELGRRIAAAMRADLEGRPE
jgi:predicted nucleic acid-binding Zn ribbon protein